MRPPLSHAGQLSHLRACSCAILRVLADIWPERASPHLKSCRREPRGVAIAPTYSLAIDLVRGQQTGPTPPVYRASKLPSEINCVPYASVHAQSACGNYKMSGVARD